MTNQSARLAVALLVILFVGTGVVIAHVNAEHDFSLRRISKNYPTTFGDKNPTEASSLGKNKELVSGFETQRKLADLDGRGARSTSRPMGCIEYCNLVGGCKCTR